MTRTKKDRTGSAAEVTGALTVAGNRVFGVNVNGSSITFSRATALVSGNALGIQIATSANAFSTQNGRVGFLADNGVGATLVNSTITGNTVRDLQFTFGTRADLQTLTFGSYTCDATVLVRGTSGVVCPH